MGYYNINMTHDRSKITTIKIYLEKVKYLRLPIGG